MRSAIDEFYNDTDLNGEALPIPRTTVIIRDSRIEAVVWTAICIVELFLKANLAVDYQCSPTL